MNEPTIKDSLTRFMHEARYDYNSGVQVRINDSVLEAESLIYLAAIAPRMSIRNALRLVLETLDELSKEEASNS